MDIETKKGVINIIGIILLAWAGYAFFNQQPPSCNSLMPNIPSDELHPGMAVTWEASAHDPNNDPLVYKFSVTSSNGSQIDRTNWGYDNTYVWKTSHQDVGTFTIQVEVRDRHHAGPNSHDAYYPVYYPIKNSPPEVTGITISPEGTHYAGDPLDINASAKDWESDAISYEFLLNGPSTTGWKSLGKSYSNKIRWQTGQGDKGTNHIKVVVSDSYNPEGTNNTTSIEIMDDPLPTIESLSPDQTSPQYQGSVITWTAHAIDKYVNPLSYRFFLSGPSTGGQYAAKTDWITNDTWTWTTSSEDFGDNVIMVWVRDGNHARPDSWDSRYYSAPFTVKAIPPPLNNTEGPIPP